MAKEKCVNCSAKPGKRKCLKKGGELICPVCCATIRNDECAECVFYQTSAEFEQKKQEKESTSAGSYFGSPAMQKAIMEASMDLMNSQASVGAGYDSDPDRFNTESYGLFSSEEFSDYSFTDEEIDLIIKELGEPVSEEGWFHTEAGMEYYSKAVGLIMSDRRFKDFSKPMMALFLKYYRKGEYSKAWLILSNSNRIMEGDFTVPFTVMMFFRGISRWKLGRN